MGGKGSGGARVGTGPKPKEDALKFLHGTDKLGERNGKTAQPVPVVDEFDAPNDLTTDERNVWLALAPHAFMARTLTRGTEFAFKLMCRNVVLERRYAGSMSDAGGANHRGLIQRIDAELARFCLAPFGKPIIEDAPKVEDPFEQFDAPESVQ